jgi:hypothetical protein
MGPPYTHGHAHATGHVHTCTRKAQLHSVWPIRMTVRTRGQSRPLSLYAHTLYSGIVLIGLWGAGMCSYTLLPTLARVVESPIRTVFRSPARTVHAYV